MYPFLASLAAPLLSQKKWVKGVSEAFSHLMLLSQLIE